MVVRITNSNVTVSLFIIIPVPKTYQETTEVKENTGNS